MNKSSELSYMPPTRDHHVNEDDVYAHKFGKISITGIIKYVAQLLSTRTTPTYEGMHNFIFFSALESVQIFSLFSHSITAWPKGLENKLE